MNKPKQLTFPWSKPNKSNYDEFYFDKSNFELKDILFEKDDLFLYGLKKTGKTFLLQSLCNEYAKKSKSSLYVPLSEISNLETQILDSIENMDIICIDEIDSIAEIYNWETAIFNLINNCQISGCRLVFSSLENPSSIKFSLNDLASRIKKINSIEIFPVSDDSLIEAIEFISKLRSINLGERELNYLLTYTERSISSLVSIINKLDEFSIEQKRKITIPLIKEVI
mgnify:FL=1